MSDYSRIREEIYREDGYSYPARSFVKMELLPSFEQAKKYRIDPLLAANEAQIAMLEKQGIISHDHARIILRALEDFEYDEYRRIEYDGKHEDLFFMIEDQLIARTDGIAGSMHIARSRNDLSVALDHLMLRKLVLNAVHEMIRLMDVVRAFAEEHKDTLYPAHTHTQQAQPSVFGHYFLGYLDVINRDIGRFTEAYRIINTSPLGAAAITTSGFPFDRKYVSELLGFDELLENSFDSIGCCDADTQTACAIMLASVNASRVITDMILWATEEMNILRVSDGYISTSSIMPQKRNPIAFEHLRASFSMIKGLCSAVIDGYLKSPYGDISDKDDIVPVLVEAINRFCDSIHLFCNVIATCDVNKELLRERAEKSFSVVTEMADTIVRITDLPFRTAHHIVAEIVRKIIADGGDLRSMNRELFTSVYKDITGKDFEGDYSLIEKSLDPDHFVAIREVTGGVGPKAMASMLCSAGDKISKWNAWYNTAAGKIMQADILRKKAVADIMNG